MADARVEIKTFSVLSSKLNEQYFSKNDQYSVTEKKMDLQPCVKHMAESSGNDEVTRNSYGQKREPYSILARNSP